MARYKKSNRSAEIVLAVLLVILVILVGVAIFLAIKWSDDPTGDYNTNQTPQTVENGQTKDEIASNGIIKTYTAIFSVGNEKNQTKIDNTIDIIYERMKLFGMEGEVYSSGDNIVINVGITETTQEDFLKYIATPGVFTVKTAQGKTILKQSMIDSYKVNVEVLDSEEPAGTLSIILKDDEIDEFKTTTESVVGESIYIMLDGTCLKFFEWGTTIASGNVVFSCFNTEELIALNVILNTGNLPVSLTALTAQSDES